MLLSCDNQRYRNFHNFFDGKKPIVNQGKQEDGRLDYEAILNAIPGFQYSLLSAAVNSNHRFNFATGKEY